MRRLIILIVVGAIVAVAFGQSRRLLIAPQRGSTALVTNAFITSQTLGTLRNDVTLNVGFEFTANANMTVISLARWVVAGNASTHVIYLLSSTCTVLGSVSVNTSGAPTGQYLYGDITPVALTSGQTYRVVSAEAISSDQFYNSDTIPTTTSDGTITFAEYRTTGVTDCTDEAAGNTFGPVNFKYYK